MDVTALPRSSSRSSAFARMRGQFVLYARAARKFAFSTSPSSPMSSTAWFPTDTCLERRRATAPLPTVRRRDEATSPAKGRPWCSGDYPPTHTSGSPPGLRRVCRCRASPDSARLEQRRRTGWGLVTSRFPRRPPQGFPSRLDRGQLYGEGAMEDPKSEPSRSRGHLFHGRPGADPSAVLRPRAPLRNAFSTLCPV